MDRSQIVKSSPEILGGEPVFAGTRVPVRTLLVYLEGRRNAGGVSRQLSHRES